MTDLEIKLHQKSAIRNQLIKLQQEKEVLDNQLKQVNQEIEEINEGKQGRLF